MKKLITLIALGYTAAISQDAVMIHGWLGDGSIWEGTVIKQVVTSSPIHFSRVLQPSLSGCDASATQASNLSNYLINNSVNNGVGIAYSMGGINSRHYLRDKYVASQQQRLSELYTIGTPHHGTRLANNVVNAGRHAILVGASAIYPGYLDENELGFVYHYYDEVAAVLAFVLLEGSLIQGIVNEVCGPATYDLREGSPAVTWINGDAAYEQNTIKVGIAGTEIDPVVWRMVSHYDLPYFGRVGENAILQWEQDVTSLKWYYMFNALITFVEHQTSENLSILAANVGTYVYFKSADNIWKTNILESQESDGVVSRASQIYPNYNRQFFANEVSHEEDKYSTVVGAHLRNALTFYGHSTLPGPTNLQATTDLVGRIVLTWDGVPNATSYFIYRDGFVESIGTSTTPTFTNNTIGSHSYIVRAFVNGLEGPPSSSVTGYAIPLQAPSSFTAEGLPSHIQLNWSFVSGATGYRLYRSTSEFGPFDLIANISNTSYFDQALPQTWYYYVVCLVGQDEGFPSSPISASAYHLASSLTSATGSNSQRTLVSANGTRYHLAYESAGSVWKTSSTDAGATWSPEVRISPANVLSGTPSLAVAGLLAVSPNEEDEVYLIYRKYNGEYGPAYEIWEGGQKVNTTNVYVTGGPHPVIGRLNVPTTGPDPDTPELLAMWESGVNYVTPGPLKFSWTQYTGHGGEAWQPEQSVPGSRDGDRNPSIAAAYVDGQTMRRLYVTYDNGNDIFFTSYGSEPVWATTVAVPASVGPPSFSSQIASDVTSGHESEHRVHIVWEALNDTEPQTDGGDSWSKGSSVPTPKHTVMYQQFLDGWSGAHEFINEYGDFSHPSVTQVSSGNVLMAWDDGTYSYKAVNNGSGWTITEIYQSGVYPNFAGSGTNGLLEASKFVFTTPSGPPYPLQFSSSEGLQRQESLLEERYERAAEAAERGEESKGSALSGKRGRFALSLSSLTLKLNDGALLPLEFVYVDDSTLTINEENAWEKLATEPATLGTAVDSIIVKGSVQSQSFQPANNNQVRPARGLARLVGDL